MNEIAKDLADSIREQKSTGSGAYHRAPSKRGPRGAVKTPVDTMTAQERREYTKPGTLVLDNMAQPLRWAIYKQLSEDDKYERLRYWASRYGISSAGKMARLMGCSYITARKEVDRLGIAPVLEGIVSSLKPEEAQTAADNYKTLKFAQDGPKEARPKNDEGSGRDRCRDSRNRPLVAIEWDGRGEGDVRQVGRMIAEVPEGRYTLRLTLEAV